MKLCQHDPETAPSNCVRRVSISVTWLAAGILSCPPTAGGVSGSTDVARYRYKRGVRNQLLVERRANHLHPVCIVQIQQNDTFNVWRWDEIQVCVSKNCTLCFCNNLILPIAPNCVPTLPWRKWRKCWILPVYHKLFVVLKPNFDIFLQK